MKQVFGVFLCLCLLVMSGDSIAEDQARTDLLDSAVQAKFDGKIRPGVMAGTTEAYIHPIFPSSHSANLLELKNGDLLCTWFSGSWEGESNVSPVFSLLKKDSNTWTVPRVVDSKQGESYQNPSPFQDPTGVLHIYHTTQLADAGEAGAHVLHTQSSDEGKTWSIPEMMFGKDGAFTRHPALILHDGRWLLPLTYVTSRGITKGAETNYSVTELSRDAGKTWTECPIEQSFGKVQPTVLELAPGHLIAFLRSRAADSIYQTTSTDGCTWTPPQATVLPNNNAAIQAFRLNNGHIVIAFDNARDTMEAGKKISALRKPLTVALSEDGGTTWKYVRDIETGRPGFGLAEKKVEKPGREEYSYPSIVQTHDGVIHVAYTFRRQTLKIISFREDWLRHGDSEGVYRKLQH